MATLEQGDEVAVGDVVAPDAAPGSPVVITECIGEFPHGMRYRGRQDSTPVLLTVVDPVLCADLATRSALTRNLQASAKTEHRSLLPLYGWDIGEPGFLILEADPGGTTVREFVRHRASRGKPLDAETVYTVIAHVCNALAALHPQIHGYVTADTVLVSTTGRVFVSSRGIGPTLPQARNFPKFRNTGRLPNIAPEQLLSPPQLSEGTDIFGAATLFLEMATGRPLSQAGQQIEELGLVGPKELVMCLERATAPAPTARPPDIPTFKAELSEAVHLGDFERAEPTPPAQAQPPPTRVPPHPYAGGRRITPVPPMFQGADGAPHWGQPPPYRPGDEGQLLRVPAADSGPIPLQSHRAAAPMPELEELDRAARKIAALDDEAALALTESVARVHDPDAEDDIAPPSAAAAGASANTSALRLSTLDGEHVPTNDNGPANVLREEKNKPDTRATPSGLGLHAADDHDQRPLYFLIKRAGERSGPFSAYDLALKARGGELAPEDLLRHRDSGEEMPVGKHPALRDHFHLQLDLGPVSAPRPKLAPVELPRPVRSAPRSAPPAPAKRGISTIWLVLGVLVAFAVAGYFLMNRGG